MFGAKIDYWLLRPLTHKRNFATEEELDTQAAGSGGIDLASAIQRVQKLQRLCGAHLPIRSDLSYLDVGCGIGATSIALARLGAERITGIDLLPRNIRLARQSSIRYGLGSINFVCEDVHHWNPGTRYDVILSEEALEHIRDPKAFLARLADFLKPGGVVVLVFGPLFHSPFGDHMKHFFRLQIPWRGVLFSSAALMRLRSERFRRDAASSFGEIAGGLNLMRYSQFLQYVAETGWVFEFLSVNPQARRFPLIWYVSNALLNIPVIRDYCASSVYAVVRRALSPPQSSSPAL